MSHTCHWPGCNIEIAPKYWGCEKHWFTLPHEIRNRIWAAYRSGQEIDKNPSREYLEVALEAQRWIHENYPA